MLWYNYKVIAFDEEGNISPDSAIIRTRHLSLDSGILVVDLTHNSNNNLLSPPKEMVEEHYRFILQSYKFDEVHYPNVNRMRLEDVGPYSTIIVHKNSFNLDFNTVLAGIMTTFIDYGGNVIYIAPDLIGNLVSLPYSEDICSSHFVREYFKINRVQRDNRTRLAYGVSSGWNNIPNLNVDPDKTPVVFQGRLNNIEAFHGDEFVVLYTHYSGSTHENESMYDGLPIGIYIKRGYSHIVLTSIPLYFVNRYQAREFIEIVLNHFEEEVSEGDETVPRLTQGLNLRNFPNPFNPYTTISFVVARHALRINIDIYNIRGQRVRTLLDGSQEFGVGVHNVVWDGRDDAGRMLGSGVYLYKAETDSGLREVRRMVLIK